MGRQRRLATELREALRLETEPPPHGVERVRREAEAHRDRAREVEGDHTGDSLLPRRRVLAGGLAGAAAGAAVGVGGFAILGDDGPAEEVPVRTLVPGARAAASIIDHAWGLEYRLDVTGLAPGRYGVVFLTRAGEVEAGSFAGVPEITRCSLTAAPRRDAVLSVEVRAADGRPVLRSLLA